MKSERERDYAEVLIQQARGVRRVRECSCEVTVKELALIYRAWPCGEHL